eukprot:7775925-Karenia_brevis.AAC.1
MVVSHSRHVDTIGHHRCPCRTGNPDSVNAGSAETLNPGPPLAKSLHPNFEMPHTPSAATAHTHAEQLARADRFQGPGTGGSHNIPRQAWGRAHYDRFLSGDFKVQPNMQSFNHVICSACENGLGDTPRLMHHFQGRIINVQRDGDKRPRSQCAHNHLLKK